MKDSKKYKKAKTKNEKSKVWGLLLILIIGFLVGAFAYTNFTEPAVVVRKYFKYLNEKNYDAMYDLVDTKLSKEEFVNRVKNIYDGIEAKNISAIITTNSYNKNENNETTISFTNKMDTIAGTLSFNNSAKVISDGEKYKISWSSKMIYPDLDDDEKVRVNTLYAKRGVIYDRNKKAIAKNGEVYSIGIIPGKMDSTTDLSKVASLVGSDLNTVEKKLKADGVTKNTFVEVGKITKDRQDEKLELLKIKGVMINEISARVYPFNEATSIMTGYVQDGEGKTGIEQEYNEKLKGQNGFEIYIEKNDVKQKSILKKEQKDGQDLYLTIDTDLQQKIYDEFKDNKSAVVSMNYNTGEILALVSTPSCDANDFSMGISEEKWNQIQNDSGKPLYNRYISGTYAPGSTLKPIIGAIGLMTNSFTASDDFGKSEKKWQKDETWGDFYVSTLEQYNETANLENALVYSDNIYFAKASLKIGKQNLQNYLEKFGFNKELNFIENMSKSTYGNLASEKEIAQAGFGQGEVLVNPLHMASLYSMFANNGNMIKPHIELNEKETEFYLQNAITTQIANEIKKDLIQVVERGTGKNAKIEGKTIAGKTGTAEIKNSQDDENGTENGWFDVFDDSEKLYVAMVEDVKDANGSHYVVNKMKNILESE